MISQNPSMSNYQISFSLHPSKSEIVMVSGVAPKDLQAYEHLLSFIVMIFCFKSLWYNPFTSLHCKRMQTGCHHFQLSH